MARLCMERMSKGRVLTRVFRGTWRRLTQRWSMGSEINWYRGSRLPISTSDPGDQCSGGIKKTWICTQSTTYTQDIQNSGTQLTSGTMINLSSSSKTSFKKTSKNARSLLGTRTHSSIRETWCRSVSAWERLHNTPGSSSSQGLLRITRVSIQGITLLKQLTSRRLLGSKWARNVGFVSARRIASKLTWKPSKRT